MGIFITFEGMDGVGKSTQIRFLSEYLKEQGRDILLIREPGGCAISEKIREILLSNENIDMCDRTEAILYTAARAQLTQEVIKPALARNKIVICDRFLDSSLAYQGYGRQIGADEILRLNEFALNGLKIDKTFFLYLDPESGFKRMNENKKRDRMEQQKDDFYSRVFDGFLELAKKYSRIELIDASGTKFETHEIIRRKIDEVLSN